MRVFFAFFMLLAFSNIHAESSPVANPPAIRARLTAKSVQLSSELAAKISKLTYEEGERFKKGQLLISFNCAEQQAQLKKAKAVKKGAEKNYNVYKRLEKLNSASILDLALAEAELLKANADITLSSAVLTKCAIHAPFSGRIAEQHAEQHQYLKAGEPILDIINDKNLEVTLLVPSNWLVWLKEGQGFKVFLEETQHEYPAKITRIGAQIDAVSQSIKITGKIVGNFKELLAGMSGKATFSQTPRKQ